MVRVGLEDVELPHGTDWKAGGHSGQELWQRLMLEIDLRVTSIWDTKAIRFDIMCQLLQRNQAKTRRKRD